MATRTITTKLALDGEKEFKQQMSQVNSQLKTIKSEMQLAEAVFKDQANSVEALTKKDELLRREIEQQQEKVKALAQAVVDASEAYGDADKRTDGYRQSLNRAQKELIEMNRELEDTEKYLKEAQDSSDGFAKSIDEFGKLNSEKAPFERLKDNFNDIKGVLTGGVVATGIKEVVGAVFDLEESTREYRQIMGSLEASSEAAGYSAKETSEAYNHLYGVLGDTQSTATTIANLQAIGAEQGDLMVLIDQVTGAWSKYGDSIPIDGLAEAINETVRSGEVTGVLADVLNWGTREGENFGMMLKENSEFTELSKKELDKLTDAQRADYEATKEHHDAIESWNEAILDAKSAEDYFNIALGECETQSERVQLIMQTMASQDLTNLGQAWRDTNEDIIKVNESNGKLEQQWARAGEMVAPMVSALKNLLGEAIGGVLDGLEDLGGKLKEWGQNAPTISELTGMKYQGQEVYDDMKEVGINFAEGFKVGVERELPSTMQMVAGFTDAVKETVTGKDGFDTHSPSKWSQEVMRYVMEGLILGAEDYRGNVMETVEDIVSEVKHRFDTLQDVFEGRQSVGDLQYELWERTYGQTASESEKLDKKLELLNGQQEDQEAIVSGAKTAYEKMVEQYGENSEESLKYQKVLLEEQLEYYELLDAIKKVREEKEKLDSTSKWIQALETATGGKLSESGKVTITALQTMTSGVVNALQTVLGPSKGEQRIEVPVYLNGVEFYRKTIDDLRLVERSNPEVTDD